MAHDGDAAQSQLPLKGVIVCSTSLAQDARTKLSEYAIQMGALHKLDLTGDVTHLIVGDIRTPKYRYVAKERPDVKVLHPDWIEEVRTQWLEGGDVDVDASEIKHRYPALAGLTICVTGFSNVEERLHLESTIAHHGATYSGDLTKNVTHLIVATPQGPKYTHARQWGIACVSAKWLVDSLGRGMALDESLYDPLIPPDDQGKGAFRTEPRTRTSLGKRQRPDDAQIVAIEDAGKRKLRRTASTRLGSQSQDVWQDISARDASSEALKIDQWNEEDASRARASKDTAPSHLPAKTTALNRPTQHQNALTEPERLFSGWHIYMHAFAPNMASKLRHILEGQCGARIAEHYTQLDEDSEDPSFRGRCVLLPHTRLDDSMDLPQVPAATVFATEWWIERCIHSKRVLPPNQDFLSQPWWDVSISQFSDLTVCSTGLSSLDLRQVAELVKLAGATYQENLLPTTSVLISGTSAVKREKAFYARKYRIPVVSLDWLKACLESQRRVPYEEFRVAIPPIDAADFSTSASSRSSPMPTSHLSNRSNEDARRKDQPPAIRLSKTRKRQPAPSLSLHPTTAATSIRPPPFVHEDEEESQVQVDCVSPVKKHSQTTKRLDAHALSEMSPNASPSKKIDDHRQLSHNTLDSSEQEQWRSRRVQEKAIPTKPQSEPGPAKPNVSALSRAPDDMTADLASLSRHLLSRRDSNSADPAQVRRKHRKLGRALSGISSRSASASAETHVNTTNGMLNVGGDPEAISNVLAEAPPSTQLGYEMPEAEAHRLQMAKKMGTSFADSSVGRKLASIGTVKDNERVTAGAATRSGRRHRLGR